MAGELEGAPAGPADWTVARNAAAAVLFMQAGMYMMDATSTLMSSPWTIENVAGDADKRESAARLVRQAAIVGGVYDLAAAWIAGSWWPVIGWGINAAYLQYEYSRAIKRGQASGSDGFGFQ